MPPGWEFAPYLALAGHAAPTAEAVLATGADRAVVRHALLVDLRVVGVVPGVADLAPLQGVGGASRASCRRQVLDLFI